MVMLRYNDILGLLFFEFGAEHVCNRRDGHGRKQQLFSKTDNMFLYLSRSIFALGSRFSHHHLEVRHLSFANLYFLIVIAIFFHSWPRHAKMRRDELGKEAQPWAGKSSGRCAGTSSGQRSSESVPGCCRSSRDRGRPNLYTDAVAVPRALSPALLGARRPRAAALQGGTLRGAFRSFQTNAPRRCMT